MLCLHNLNINGMRLNEKYREYFFVGEEGGKIYAERIYSASLVRFSLGLYYVQNIKPILYKRVVSRLLIGVSHMTEHIQFSFHSYW